MAQRKRDPYLTQAQLAGVVRYRPKYDALVQALADAQGIRDQGIAAAKSGAQGQAHAIDLAKPQVQSIYSDAGYNPELANAPKVLPAEVNFQAAGQFEQGAAQQRLGVAQARALQDLSDKRLSALAGGEYGAKQASQQFASDAYKISQQLASVGDQQGAFVAKTLGDLHESARKRAVQIRGQNITQANNIRSTTTSENNNIRSTNQSAANNANSTAQSERNSLRSRGIDPDTGRVIPGGPLDPSAKPRKSPFTPVARRTAARTVRSGVDTLAAIPTPLSPAAAEHVALNGLRSVGAKGQRNGPYIIKPVTNDPFLAKVIAERYHRGGVSKSTNKRLKRQYGITAKPVSPYVQALGSTGLPGV